MGPRRCALDEAPGIIAEEWCMVSFDGALSTTAVSKLGLAFVAWTRATRWEKMAFHKLPLLEHLVAPRLTREFALKTPEDARQKHKGETKRLEWQC